MQTYCKWYLFFFLIFFIDQYFDAASFKLVAQGCKTKNIFLTQKDLINKLTWQVSGDPLPVQYGIYRDAQLTDNVGFIASSSPFVLYDHNRVPGVVYTYYIIGIYQDNSISSATVVTVTSEC